MSDNEQKQTRSNPFAQAEVRQAGTHFRQAGVEVLKGVRSLLDSGIHALSRYDENKGVKVTVE